MGSLGIYLVCDFFDDGVWFALSIYPTPGSFSGEDFGVPLLLVSLALILVFHVLHLWVTLVFPIEVVLSSIEGEMDAARVDLSPTKVELDANGYAGSVVGGLMMICLSVVWESMLSFLLTSFRYLLLRWRS
ncbi:hypothetical protein SUGI_0876730 [Cryptomeria japonica]|nr:hypothetical protein SUGI_0876730 [Cryptomeria japonica]